MRSMNPNGVPYPRHRPVDWDFVKHCLKSHRETRARKAAGFRRIRVLHTQTIEYLQIITDVEIAEDGYDIWIRTERRPI